MRGIAVAVFVCVAAFAVWGTQHVVRNPSAGVILSEPSDDRDDTFEVHFYVHPPARAGRCDVSHEVHPWGASWEGDRVEVTISCP